MTELELPIGPSANNLFPGKLRRYKSKEYRHWLVSAGWEIKVQKPVAIAGPFHLLLLLPTKMRGDASNRLKAVEDLLVKHGVTIDDRHAMSSKAERSDEVPDGRCLVRVWAA